MPVPVVASIAGRVAGQVLCETGTNMACEEIYDCLNTCQGQPSVEEDNTSPKKSTDETDPNDGSNRTLQSTNRKPKPVELLQKQQSATMFARASTTDDTPTVDAKEQDEKKPIDVKKTKVFHSTDGEESFFEVRFTSTSKPFIHLSFGLCLTHY